MFRPVDVTPVPGAKVLTSLLTSCHAVTAPPPAAGAIDGLGLNGPDPVHFPGLATPGSAE
jgi:hypothetical protein